jgi:hypothetical protein
MEEENHFTQTQLSDLLLHLQAFTFTLLSLHSHSSLNLLSQNHASFIGIHGIFSTMVAHGLIHLSMVGATTIDKW